MDTAEHVTKALEDATILRNPFPYFYAQNVFPKEFYKDFLTILRCKTDFHTEKFANRTFADSIDEMYGIKFMLREQFAQTVLNLFSKELKEKFGGTRVQFETDLRLIRDQQHYKIGPHTDAPWKVISLLFYLPPDGQHSDYGTSIYVPKDPTFTCEGGPHHPFEHFNKVWTAPFAANTCLGFWKTNKSFHGVAPIPVNFQRDVLLFNIYRKR